VRRRGASVSRRNTSVDGGAPTATASVAPLELLAAKHVFWLSGIGLGGALVAFGVTVWLLWDSADVDKLIPAALGALFTLIGTILGHMQGGASGRADASSARGEAAKLRAQVRAYERDLPPEATKKVRDANSKDFA
jgi:hypothetical protein